MLIEFMLSRSFLFSLNTLKILIITMLIMLIVIIITVIQFLSFFIKFCGFILGVQEAYTFEPEFLSSNMLHENTIFQLPKDTKIMQSIKIDLLCFSTRSSFVVSLNFHLLHTRTANYIQVETLVSCRHTKNTHIHYLFICSTSFKNCPVRRYFQINFDLMRRNDTESQRQNQNS